MKNIVTTLCCLLLASTAAAGELVSSSVEHDDNRYVLEFDMRINANPLRVYELITDYNHLGRVNDSIEESELLVSLDDHNHRVRLVSDACVLFFCKTIRQVQMIEEINNQIVIATVIPEKSDFDYAHARWHVRPENGGTRIMFNADLKPSFWVPPLIGPSIVKSKLENEVIGTIENLETLANQDDSKAVQ